MKLPRKAVLADLALFSVAVFWGFNFVVIKSVTERLTGTEQAYGKGIVAATMLYLFFRYIVATVIFTGIRPRALFGATRRQWGMGGLLGCFYLTALVVQTIGLQHTTPGKSGFITGLSVAMVPFLYWAFARRSPGWAQAAGAIVATAGLGVLSLRGNLTMSWGDALTLLGALLYALHIMATGFFAPKVPPSTLAVTQMAVSTILCALVTPFVAHITLQIGWQAWVEIIWTALSGTIYAFFIQAWAQQYTTSTHAAVLLCFESVFAAVSGVIFGMDTVTLRMILGASLIFSGTMIIELLPGGQSRGDAVETAAGAAVAENEAPPQALLPIEAGEPRGPRRDRVP